MEAHARGVFIGVLAGVVWGAAVATLVTIGIVGLPPEDITLLLQEACR